METLRNISGCGILGVLRRDGTPKIKGSEAVSSIECVRYRGSKLGAGFAAYNLDAPNNGRYKVKAFVSSEEALKHVKNVLREFAEDGIHEDGYDMTAGKFMSWTALISSSQDSLRNAVDRINYELMNAGMKGRIYSWGRYVEVFKGVGYPLDVAQQYGLVERKVEADLWIAHTRQPTNSPGIYPIWSHPFSSHEWAIAHNGDISSFGANMEFMMFKGFRSFVGTDSELIAYILDYLTNIKKMPIEKVAQALVNPFEEDILNGLAGITIEEYAAGRGAWLDGPFSVVAGYCDGEDVYMLALADRSKFRPLVVGFDEKRFYVASEEAEVRQLSEKARVWPVKPGGFFLASMKKGIICTGREHPEIFYHTLQRPPPVGTVVDALGLGYSEVNRRVRMLFEKGITEVSVVNVNGHRYLGFNMPPATRLNIYGTAGNCLANFNKHGEIIVYGNAQDDVGDAMYGGRVVIHGDARDVVGQALQGGEIFVRGSVGNRAAIQMREFRDSKPYLIVGGRADDYLGEYMAGGVVMVLGIDSMDLDTCLVGRYMATGMVGGKIYVRGRVDRWRIGLQPPKPDVLRYIHSLHLQGYIDEKLYKKFEAMQAITIEDVSRNLYGEALRKVTRLFTSKYYKELDIEVRRLDEDETGLIHLPLKRFFREFNLGDSLFSRILKEEFTVVKVKSTQTSQQQSIQPEEG
ncbi:MAG: glutamate synthase [Candidatus Caldarchaeum sp.]|nr:glutamate synthase [Candidatus Caldarchaeum sp.]